MDVLASVASAICNSINRLVRCLVEIGDGEAQKRLQLDLEVSTNRCAEVSQQNQALTQDLHQLQIKFQKVQAQLCSQLEGSGSYVDGSATPCLLESTLKTLNLKVSRVAKLFVDLMKSYGLDHGQALMTHFNRTYLTRPAHVNFMLKAWIYSVLFENFENENFLPGGATLFLDHNERKLKSFECFQRIITSDSTCDYSTLDYASDTFWRRKLPCFLALWPILLASPSAGRGQNRSCTLYLIENGYSMAHVEALEPRTQEFIRGFAAAANIVWAVHKLCLSFEPCARIFRVDRGAEYIEEYMNSVVSKNEDPKFVSVVGFMISPGFYVRKSVLKCQIYLGAEESSQLRAISGSCSNISSPKTTLLPADRFHFRQ